MQSVFAWLLLVVIALPVGILIWLERRDRRVLKDYLHRKFPSRQTRTYWGDLDSPEEDAPSGEAVDAEHHQELRRRKG